MKAFEQIWVEFIRWFVPTIAFLIFLTLEGMLMFALYRFVVINEG